MPKDATVALYPGAVFHGRYRVVWCLKAGGMGALYEVVDERTDRPRALKVMLPSMVADPDLRARFALEAKVTGKIASDHIVGVSDAGIDEATGTPFLVMELLCGQDLGSVLTARGPLPADEVLLYLHQTALALDKTHAAGIVHRDLKPENLFVTARDDGSRCVKILDFGVAKVVAEGMMQKTHAVGTPIYMAPEQIRGEPSIGPRADLFALGHIAYTLLMGEPYWREELKASPSVYRLLTVVAEGMPELPSARAQRRCGVVLPASFDTWMMRAVAGPQEDRFDGASAQVAALAEVLGLPAPRSTLLAGPAIAADPAMETMVLTSLSPSGGALLPSSPGASGPPPITPAGPGGLETGPPSHGATPRAIVRNTAPPPSRSAGPVALGVVALGALALLVARSRPAPAVAPANSTAPSQTTAVVIAASAPPVTMGSQAAPSPGALLAPSAPTASAAGAPSASSASAVAPVKAPPSGTSAPRRVSSPRPAAASTPAAPPITSPL